MIMRRLDLQDVFWGIGGLRVKIFREEVALYSHSYSKRINTLVILMGNEMNAIYPDSVSNSVIRSLSKKIRNLKN